MRALFGVYPSWQRDSDPVGISDPACFSSQQARFPTESIGVVHVLTEIPADDPGYAFSGVTLQRYEDGELGSPVPIVGSVSESPYALSMHVHWCDHERLIRCVFGENETLCVWDIDWEIVQSGDDVYDRARPPSEGDDPGSSERVAAIIARAADRFRRQSFPCSPELVAVGLL